MNLPHILKSILQLLLLSLFFIPQMLLLLKMMMTNCTQFSLIIPPVSNANPLTGWDDARILYIEKTANIRNIRGWPIWHAQPFQSANPVWIFLLSGSPSSVMRFLTHREDLYEVTGSTCFSVRLQSWMLRVSPQMALVVDTTCLHNFFPISLHWCSCTWFCWLWLWHKFLPPLLSQFHTCACFITNFTADVLVTSRRINLVSSN
jgi:hypothetical protein